MLNTFYHRNQAPWVYQKEDGKIEISLRIGKNIVERIEVIYGDALGLYMDGEWVKTRVKMEFLGETTNHEIYSAELNNRAKRYRYAFEITFKDGSKYLIGEVGELKSEKEINIEGNGFTYAYWVKENMLNSPKWFRHTNWYQIFPDRFNKSKDQKGSYAPWDKIKPNSHELYGGNIKGITEKLQYIKNLGFSGIYLTPIFKSTSSHRYNTTDYYSIDPVLGTEEDFKELIKKAHKIGLRIMLDAVFNHIGDTSIMWQDVLKNKNTSKYKDWFWINDMTKVKSSREYSRDEFQKDYPYETFSYVPPMPRLNWSNPEVKKYLFGATKKWTEMGIDGWRLDVSFAPSKDFWRDFKKIVSAINPEIAIVGEVWWDSIDWLNGDMWDGVMNYPLRKVIIEFVQSSKKEKDKLRFVHRFNELAFSYTPEQQWSMFNLISSHDIIRAITLFKNDETKFKQALLMMYFQPGSTSTYYGEEIGLEGEADPDNRRPMPWGKTRIDFKSFMKDALKTRELFVNTSSIYDRYVAKLIGGIITISNSTNKITINGEIVKREEL